MADPLMTTALLAVTLSGALCALGAWVAPARKYDADGSPLGFPWAGAAFALALTASVALHADGPWRVTALGIVFAVLFLFAVGSVSEWLPESVGRLLRLAAIAVATWFVVAQGLRIHEVKLPFGPVTPLGPASAFASAVWVFAVCALVTLSNRGEALVPGISVFSALAMCAVATLAGSAAVSVNHALMLGLATAGAALPVLSWCNPPSRVRFGAGGGLAAGMALACVSVLGAVKNAAFLVLVVPALCLGAPLVASIMTLALNRERPLGVVLREAQRITFVGVLVRRGLTARQAVAFLLVWHVYLCLLAIGLTAVIRHSWMLKAAMLVGFGAVGAAGFALTFQILYGWRTVGGSSGVSAITLLGVRIDRTTYADAVERAMLWARSSRLHHIVTADATLVERASRDPELGAIVGRADLVTPDGAGVLFAARLLGAPFAERVAGVDLVGRLAEAAVRERVSLYLLGAEPSVAEIVARRLESLHPGLVVAGVHHGYFAPDEESSVVESIAGSGARILLVGLGVPRQELFIDRNRERLNVGVAVGVGGSFDVLSGRVRRAPRWMQSVGLEWLWRVLRDPRRVPRLVALPRFVARVLAHAVADRRGSRQRVSRPPQTR